MNQRRAIVTEEHRKEAASLKAIWDSTPHPSQAEFGETYNIGNQSAVSQFLNGKTPLSLEAAASFARGLACSISDFSPRLARQAELIGAPSNQSLTSSFDKNVLSAPTGERRIPLLNYIQAGDFADCGQNFAPEDVEFLLTDLDLSMYAFALQIKGDSMLPEFKEGDRIIVDCEIAPRPGDYVVARNSAQEATFKKYRLLRINDEGEEVFELTPLNDDYPSLRSDQHRIHIIGTMVEHRKYYRRS